MGAAWAAVLFAVAAVNAAAYIPIHETLHCAGSWVQESGPCIVTYSAPGPNKAEAYAAHANNDDHVWIYPIAHATWALPLLGSMWNLVGVARRVAS